MTVPLLMVGNFLSARGGHRHYCEDLADELERAGRTVVRTSSQPGRFARLREMLVTAWSRRRAYRIAVVDVFSGPAFVWAEAVCFELDRMRVPYVLALRGGNLPGFSLKWPWRVKRLLANAARITAPSQYLHDRMLHLAPAIQVIPNALDLARYPQIPSRAPVRLIWLRTFHELYAPLLAVEVMALLHRDYPALQLRMIGPDRDGSLERTRQRIAERGLAATIEIVPGIEKANVGSELAAGDIFLNTSSVDNTPVTVLEAMACGLPVVSTNVGGIPYLLRDGEDALLVRPNEPAEMAGAVERLLTDRTLAARISRNAREATRNLDWARVIERWERLLGDVVNA